MAGTSKPIPEGFHTLTPHLVVRNAAQAIEFYKRAFGAEVRGVSHHSPDGKITHAELKIGDSILMLADEFPEANCLSPQALGGSPITLHIYVEDVDTAFSRAVAAGATVTMPLADQFWGDRYGQLVDPFGHRWSLATHKQDLTHEEIRKAAEAVFAKMAKQAPMESGQAQSGA
jgi:uncharacterized glyoxalase superfamily protein PhnB